VEAFGTDEKEEVLVFMVMKSDRFSMCGKGCVVESWERDNAGTSKNCRFALILEPAAMIERNPAYLMSIFPHSQSLLSRDVREDT
jgi:hypothetical protein